MKHIGIEGLGQIKCALNQWGTKLASAMAAEKRDAIAQDLNARIQYDVGLSDSRPIVPKFSNALRYPASVEAMLNRRC